MLKYLILVGLTTARCPKKNINVVKKLATHKILGYQDTFWFEQGKIQEYFAKQNLSPTIIKDIDPEATFGKVDVFLSVRYTEEGAWTEDSPKNFVSGVSKNRYQAVSVLKSKPKPNQIDEIFLEQENKMMERDEISVPTAPHNHKYHTTICHQKIDSKAFECTHLLTKHEDCLTLDLYLASGQEKRPLVIWIPGTNMNGMVVQFFSKRILKREALNVPLQKCRSKSAAPNVPLQKCHF